MKNFAATLALVAPAIAYPHLGGSQPGDIAKRASLVPFDAETQRVDVSGAHAFVPPNFDAGDIRGPCPGLNALANHNYLPHNGVATIDEFVQSTTEVYGMGVDLAEFLAVLGATLDGDGTSWSIGGPPPTSLTSVAPGVLGYPQGISGSHNKYESDSSPTRPDLYEYGNDYKLRLPQFEQLYAMQADAAEPNYSLEVLAQFRSIRYDQSVEENPYFFYGPFTGVLVSQAAFTFIYRFMANHTAEYPEGILNKEVLKSFFAISGDDDNLVWTPGHEQIPYNWYRRNEADAYTIPYFNLDVVDYITQYPKLASVGGNTGTTNSFAGIDVENLSGGLMNQATLLQGNNAFCYFMQGLTQLVPDVSTVALTNLANVLASTSSKLSCPQLTTIDYNQFKNYPGYSKLKTGGVYKA